MVNSETTEAPRLLVIEDDGDIRDLVRFNLEKEGFEVDTAADGELGLEMARRRIYDALLLDLMLPGLDGYEICRRLRDDSRTSELPILMVTSRGEESDVVQGLGLGADDYICKPFSVRELIARVKSTLRRARAVPASEHKKPIRRGGIEVDPVRHEVTANGKLRQLTLTEFRLLYHLLRHPGRVFSRSELLPHVVGREVVVVDRNIDVHVRNIRKKLGAPASDRIITVRGIGYKFEDRY